MTTEQLHQAFADIHKGAAACGEDFDRLEKYRKHVKYELLPILIKQYKTAHPDISWGDAYLAVRKAHIEYIGTLFPRDGITAEPYPGFVSKQIPVLDEDGKFHCCYRRDEAGLPAFREHTLTFNGHELIHWYHHSSPVPYEIKDFQQRLKATIQNLEQLPGQTIAEIRLLSPMKGLKEKFTSPFVKKYFTTLNDYDQLLETAIAAELCGKVIFFFNLGVNDGRKHASSLQKKLNIRALKTLLSRIPLSGISVSPNMFTLSVDDENIKTSFLTQLAAQNPEEYSELPQNIDHSTATDEQKKLYKDIMELLSTGKWIDHNFQAQAKLVRLNYLLGHTVATGCNDAKDRDGALTNVIEANAIAPFITHLTVEEILPTIRENSSAKTAAEMVSMPDFAKGLDVESNPHRNIPKIFKLIYTETQYEAYKKRDAQTAPVQPQLIAKEKSFWKSLSDCFAGIGNRIKKLGRGISTAFWGVLLAVGIITAASASTDTMQDGASSPDNMAFSITLPGDETPTPPQPLQKRNDEMISDETRCDSEEEVSLDEEDCFSSANSSSNASPTQARKSSEEQDYERINRWKEIRGSSPGDTVSMVQAAMRKGLISSKPLSGGYSLSDIAQAERDKIPRRFTQ